MPRRVYITKQDMWRKRQFWYANHYTKRTQAAAYPIDDALRTLQALSKAPTPRLDLDGSIPVAVYWSVNVISFGEMQDLIKYAGTPAELFVRWYWSKEHWQEFVDQFNALPEPEAKYEIVEWNGKSIYEAVGARVVHNRDVYKPASLDELYTGADENQTATPLYT